MSYNDNGQTLNINTITHNIFIGWDDSPYMKPAKKQRQSYKR